MWRMVLADAAACDKVTAAVGGAVGCVSIVVDSKASYEPERGAGCGLYDVAGIAGASVGNPLVIVAP